MKKVFLLLSALTLIFTILSVAGSQDRIVICASSEQFRNDALQEQLNEHFPEYDIAVMYMSTGKAAAKILAEGKNTEVDILVGLETGYLSKIQANLSDISGISQIPYLEDFSPENNHNLWVTWERQAGAIIVNTTILEKHGLEAPRSYDDLLKPEYRGLIAMPDPKSSGTGYFFYKNWVNTKGEEGALAYVDALYPNLKQFTESGSGPIKLLKQGEIAIGLALTFQAVNEINDGQPFEIIFPAEGSPYSLTGTAMISGRENNQSITEVFDYIVNQFMIYDKENFSPEPIYNGQRTAVPNYPQNIVYADMTGIQDAAQKERLLSLWKY